MPQYNFKETTPATSRATTQGAKRVVATILLIAALSAVGFAQSQSNVPRFRHIDPAATEPTELPQGIVRLLTDQDFAPFSFPANDGSQSGLSVELARAACAELRLACEVVAMPHAGLLPALLRGEGDVIITGAKLDATILKSADTTRAYFISMGRFFVHKETPLADASIRTLAGKRIGYVRGTLHGAFVEKTYARSTLLPFDTANAMFTGLKAKELDAAFTDGLYSMFWLAGPAAASCCAPLGKPFIDRATFSRSLTFLASKDRKNLRQSLDYALDRLEEKGVTARIIARYVPGSVW